MKAESRTLFDQVNELPMDERRKFAAQMVVKLKDEDARRTDAFTKETDSILGIVSTAKYHREAMAHAPVIYSFTFPAQHSIEYRPNPYAAVPQAHEKLQKDNGPKILRRIAEAVFILVCIIAHFCV